MKRFMIFAAAAAMALSTAAGAAGFDKAVILGDSIASGYGLDGYTAGDNYSAAESFGNRLAADCGECINLAVDGRTTAQLLEAIDTEEMSEAITGADCVIVSIGGNDFLQPMISAAQLAMFTNPDIKTIFQGGDVSDIDLEAVSEQISSSVLQAANAVDTAKSGENISGILAKINALNPTAEVKLLTVYNPFENTDNIDIGAMDENSISVQAFSFASIFDSLNDIAEEKLAQLNYEIVNAANANGAEIIDVHSAFKGNAAEYTNITAFDVHPNKNGHAVIYSLITGSNSVQTSAPVKNSPATGAESVAAAVGAAVIGLASVIALGKKRA